MRKLLLVFLLGCFALLCANDDVIIHEGMACFVKMNEGDMDAACGAKMAKMEKLAKAKAASLDEQSTLAILKLTQGKLKACAGSNDPEKVMACSVKLYKSEPLKMFDFLAASKALERFPNLASQLQ